jgi:hypothetical protein
MEVVVENKNAPGNGLTDVVGPQESDPLNNKEKSHPPPPPPAPSGNKNKGKSNNKNSKGRGGLFSSMKKEKMTNESPLNAEADPEDPGPSVSDSENEQEASRKRSRRRQGPRKDIVGIYAHKCRLTPKRGLIYLLFSGAVIILLLFILFLLAALWPRGPSHPPCLTAQCHHYSGAVLGALNNTVQPCDAYWEYSCGGWLREHPLPKSKAYWDVQAYHEFNGKKVNQ